MPAILVHALNNGMSVVAGIVRYAATDKAADSVTVGMYVFWLLVGAAATIYLLVNKSAVHPEKPKWHRTRKPQHSAKRMGAFFGRPRV